MPKADQKIIDRCKKGLASALEREQNARDRWKADYKFANADPDNGYQWDAALLKARMNDPNGARPALTINKTKQHNRQITNEARQNKPAVRVFPVDGGADKKTAQILNGIIRHIEANSDADSAYETATEHQVDAGVGYWRVVTDYASDDSFDQEIFIRRIKNPLNVVLGDHNEADASDAREGWIFNDVPRDEFLRRYPNVNPADWDALDSAGWVTRDTVRECEYFLITDEEDTLIVGDDGATVLWSKLSPEDQARYKLRNDLRKRPVKRAKLTWYKLGGDGEQLDSRELAGRYIPIVKVVGEELEIDGEIDRKGHTRGMKDAQRMYNYWTSAGVEFGALQGKQPYLAPAEAIEGYEEYWNNINKSNQPYLPYNAFDGDGNAIPMPVRQQPPVAAPMYMSGMQVAAEELKMASGQYDSSLGRSGNATSGRQELAQQQKGDTATFHFRDNVARAIRYTGKILVDLIPKIYDTPRIARMLGEDGKDDEVQIDPSMKVAYREEQDPMTNEIKRIFNPSIGRYDVRVGSGPSYSTRRQEAFYALTDLAGRNPQVMQVAGDLVMKAADFPMAEELAERFEKALPPNIKDKNAPTPEMQQLQQKLEQTEAQLQALGQQYNQLHDGREVDERKLYLDQYRAETERLKIIYPQMPQQIAQVIAQDFGLELVNEAPLTQGNGEPGPPPAAPPPPEAQQQYEENPPSAGFSLPEPQ
ncbi:portal protein [Massilia sp. LC238]|uniref:portal protein n=1 Tax=Massilia sp. LC238 TaxID=1502852 RepID=UPI0004E3D2C1|nr:portal protein [Massilia sp. LC238]KFC61950.1 hypothetical protein FG94_04990 [Massilia sp. LC238]